MSLADNNSTSYNIYNIFRLRNKKTFSVFPYNYRNMSNGGGRCFILEGLIHQIE